MTDEGPRLAQTQPASVNDTTPPTVDGTKVTTDVASKAATVIRPVMRTVKAWLR